MPIRGATSSEYSDQYFYQGITDAIMLLCAKIAALIESFFGTSEQDNLNRTIQKLERDVSVLREAIAMEGDLDRRGHLFDTLMTTKMNKWDLTLLKEYGLALEAAKITEQKVITDMIASIKNCDKFKASFEKSLRLPVAIRTAWNLVLTCPNGTKLPEPLQRALAHTELPDGIDLSLLDPNKVKLDIAFFESLKDIAIPPSKVP